MQLQDDSNLTIKERFSQIKSYLVLLETWSKANHEQFLEYKNDLSQEFGEFRKEINGKLNDIYKMLGKVSSGESPNSSVLKNGIVGAGGGGVIIVAAIVARILGVDIG